MQLSHPYPFGQLPYSLNDIPTAAVVGSDIERQAIVIFRQRFRAADPLLQTRAEPADIADHPQPDVMFMQAFYFTIQSTDKSSIRAETSCTGRFQFSLLKA